MRAAIGPADVITALSRLGVSDSDVAMDVARALGWDLELDRPEPPPAPEREPQVEPSDPPPRPQRTPPTSAPPARSEGSHSVLRPLPPAPELPPPGWLAAGDPMERATEPYLPAPPEPLVPRQALRGLVVALAAARVPSAELDATAAIRALTTCEALRELPRRAEWTVRRGVHVLVDDGAAMTVFRDDVAEVLHTLRGAVASHHVTRFRGTPPATAPGWRGATSLLVTDLGIGRSRDRASESAWIAWLADTHARGVRAVALVPYRASRWPQAIAARLPCVHWDPQSKAGRVSARVRVRR